MAERNVGYPILDRLPAVAAMVICAIVTAACASTMTRVTDELRQIESALDLRVRPASSNLTSGRAMAVELALLNRAPQAVDACIGVGRQVLVLTDARLAQGDRPPVGVTSKQVDHSYCVTRFHLESGATFTWTEPLELPRTSLGQARLSMSVEILIRRGCGRWGCYSTSVSGSAPVVIE